MKRVDYDDVAPSFDRRYESNRYDGTRASLFRFLDTGTWTAVAEVGCGTGHWLAEISLRSPGDVFGLDLSARMLDQARIAAPAAHLARGTADRLPLANASVDRIFCINALHHFSDQPAFIAQCHRVLRPGGGVLTVGLDPHVGRDQWWVYDYFPAALAADRVRYPATATLRQWFAAAGFDRSTSTPAEHFPAAVPFDIAVERGIVDRQSASQLMVISDADYDAGMTRLRGDRPVLRADLTLYATTAWRGAP
jgi:ubiquinone/menaquinone biosynthesis C-methylase UbiE